MSPGGRSRNQSPRSPGHIFIEQTVENIHQGNSRVVSSHARKFQLAGKRRQQRSSAMERAAHARSLVGWQSRSASPKNVLEETTLARSKSTTDDALDPAMSLINVSINIGLRADPFNSFPSSNSKSVMDMVDYHIHVWSPHKAGNFDDLMGYNTQLELCWPLALQDEMLFDATLAVSRTACVLSQHKDPSEDQLMLYHRGLAMTALRRRVSLETQKSLEALIFCIGRMISIAYMSSEFEAFIAHFEAFRTVCARYIEANPNTDTSLTIQNRLDSWTALHAYRTGRNLLCGSEATTSFGSPQELAPHQQGRSVLPTLPLSPALDSVLRSLDTVSLIYQSSWDFRSQSIVLSNLQTSTSQLARILASPDMSPIELQFSCALLAYCLQLYGMYQALQDQQQSLVPAEVFAEPAAGDALPALSKMGDTFLYQKLEGFSTSPTHRTCLTWCALVLGSFLSQQFDHHLRGKGHIIHVSLAMRLNVNVNNGPAHNPVANEYGWSGIESELEGATMSGMWFSGLVQEWRNDWVNSMRRQQGWESHGLFKIGVPKAVQVKWERAGSGSGRGRGHTERGRRTTRLHEREDENSPDVDVIEYLVLRDARDSLPRI
ncbi:uncharacterized protein PV06_05777 [Exophiala oligosperma]|uniref:Transcription factor domain-containing protein n=1 Tax=Exophiala oligosperma TaxID=215243 RepID=A0A0D2BXG5_9EURO|nr:uncharacterized protein PV06_05777 [Exophiala oligosperma]KIW42212.1 hypothetical protein PV06_05777 [Exophiala oligosperma]